MIIWIVAVLAVAIAGSALWRVLPALGWPFRASVAFVAGAVYVTTVMFAASAVGVRWGAIWIAIALLVPAVLPLVISSVARNQGGWAGGRNEVRRTAPPPGFLATLGMTGVSVPAIITVFATLTAWGTLTARETCADLVYFWGTKATRFAAARAIDLPFLADPAHLLMHPDYPPLVPLLYAWGAMFAWSYWGPLLLTAVLLAMTAFVVEPFSKTGAMLMAALLAFTYAQGLAAGAADPMLVLFEVTALAALTFIGETRGGPLVASIALAGAAMTKVEGAAFVAVAIVAYAIVSRKPLRALAIAIAPAILLGAWLLYARQHGLASSYSHGALQFSAATLVEVVKAASYHAYYLPWLAVLVPLALIRKWKRAALPLATAAGSIAYILFFYMHTGADTHLWIAVSAERVLITPLASLAVAVAVATPSE